MPQVLIEAEHVGELGHHLALHMRCCGAAIEGVGVRINEHRGEVTDNRRRVGWFQHLPHIPRVAKRVVVCQPFTELLHGSSKIPVRDHRAAVRTERFELIHPALVSIDDPGKPLA